MVPTDEGRRLRIVLLSCSGAPFSAELVTTLYKLDRRKCEEIVGIVLSKPKLAPRNEPSRLKTIVTLMKAKGLVAAEKEIGRALGYRLNRVRHMLVSATRSILRQVGAQRSFPWSRIEDVCEGLGIEPYVTRDINSAESTAMLRTLAPDVVVIATFNHILEAPAINVASIATLNVHCSLLPKHRGADPINAVLSAGESETGVTIHWVDEGIDTGDIVMQGVVGISSGIREPLLRKRLAHVAAGMLNQCLCQARKRGLGRRVQGQNVTDN